MSGSIGKVIMSGYGKNDPENERSKWSTSRKCSIKRVEVIQKAVSGEITVLKASEILGIS